MSHPPNFFIKPRVYSWLKIAVPGNESAWIEIIYASDKYKHLIFHVDLREKFMHFRKSCQFVELRINSIIVDFTSIENITTSSGVYFSYPVYNHVFDGKSQ